MIRNATHLSPTRSARVMTPARSDPPLGSESSCTSTDAGHVTKVAVGTKVKWIYADDECDANALCPGHNVHLGTHTSADVKQDGALIKAMTFNSVGKFHYWCTHHSTDTNHTTGMYGYIKVHS